MNIPSCFMLQKLELSAGLMAHLARKRALTTYNPILGEVAATLLLALCYMERNKPRPDGQICFVKSFNFVYRGELPSVQQSHVAIAQLRHPVNLGRSLEETHLVVLVLAPSKTVST